tara:strand:+ start:118 stop:312 length:195 start_codon:yes stop_codon:yes gene_type:complete
MSKLSEINLGSAILSIVIVAGFIATTFAVVRLTIIGINYVRVNYLKDKGEGNNKKEAKSETKGF